MPRSVVRKIGVRLVIRRIATPVGVGLSLMAAVAAAAGWWRIAISLVALIQAGAVMFLIDIRARMARARDVDGARRALERAERRLDNVGRSVLGAVEDGRVETNDQLEDLLKRQDALEQQVSRGLERNTNRQNWAGNQRSRQFEAWVQLYTRVKPRLGMPASGGWAMDAANLLSLVDVVEADRPDLVVELGGGTSSLWVGYTLEQLGSGRLVSIDHDPDFADATRAQLRRHGLDHIVEVRVASLAEAVVPGHEAMWYDPGVFKDLSDIDLLVVDGPPKSLGDLARYPAMPVLAGYLSDQAVVVLDDAHRPDEKAALRRWCDETPGLRVTELAAGDHLAILTKGQPPPATNEEASSISP